jgi:hypothetical protein
MNINEPLNHLYNKSERNMRQNQKNGLLIDPPVQSPNNVGHCGSKTPIKDWET